MTVPDLPATPVFCSATADEPNFCYKHNAVWPNGFRVCAGWEPRPTDHYYGDGEIGNPDFFTEEPATCQYCGYTTTERVLLYVEPCPNIPQPPSEPEESPLVTHARQELERAGLFETDADYDGNLGHWTLDIVKLFASQGHSGSSANMVTQLVNILLQRKPLTALTADPQEWAKVPEGIMPGVWQSRRDPTAFSKDGGITYKYNSTGKLHHSLPVKDAPNAEA